MSIKIVKVNVGALHWGRENAVYATAKSGESADTAVVINLVIPALKIDQTSAPFTISAYAEINKIIAFLCPPRDPSSDASRAIYIYGQVILKTDSDPATILSTRNIAFPCPDNFQT
jgi:hypothetical protein